MAIDGKIIDKKKMQQEHYHQVKLIDMNTLQAKAEYCQLIKAE